MKVLIAYLSITGNTKKIAETIYNEIKTNKEIKKIDEVNDLSEYDLSFLGFPIHSYSADDITKNFLEKKTKNKNIALFITHASHEIRDADVLQKKLDRFKEAVYEAKIFGFFNCQGELAENIKKIMLNHPKPDIRYWAKRDTSKGQPDFFRLNRARVFARETILKFKEKK